MRESRMVMARSSLALAGVVVILSLVAVARSGAGDATEPPTVAADRALAGQVAELQKQVAELAAQVRSQPRILAAGTAAVHIEKTSRIDLPAGVARKLTDDDGIVIATTRAPVSGLPIFAPFWKPAKNGFDLWLTDVTLPPNSIAEYWGTRNRTFVVDWIVVASK